jgi:hypothetical protein
MPLALRQASGIDSRFFIPRCKSSLRARPVNRQLASPNDHPANLRATCNQHVDPSAVVGFIDRNYRYKSVANQILYGGGSATIPYNGRKFLPYCRSNRRLQITIENSSYIQNNKSLTQLIKEKKN